MLKNLTVFNVSRLDFDASKLASALHDVLFNKCGSQNPVSFGFSPVIKDGGLTHQVGKHIFLNFSIEKKLLPASVIKEFTAAETDKFIEREGCKPNRKQAKEIKEGVVHSLMPKAFGVKKDTLVWISPKDNLLCVNSTSKGVVDLFLTALFKCTSDKIQMSLVQTERSPESVMTEWLVDGNVSHGFVINEDCLLKNTGAKSSVRISKRPLDTDDMVSKQISKGDIPAELALIWDDKVSFTLGCDLSIKKIKLLDVENEKIEDEVARMEADLSLHTGLLSIMLSEIFASLGGVRHQ